MLDERAAFLFFFGGVIGAPPPGPPGMSRARSGMRAPSLREVVFFALFFAVAIGVDGSSPRADRNHAPAARARGARASEVADTSPDVRAPGDRAGAPA